MLLCLFLFACEPLSAQRLKRVFHNRNYDISFSDSNTFVVTPPNFYSTLATLGYKNQWILSYGTYVKKGRYYILTADESIRSCQGTCRNYQVELSHTSKEDSLYLQLQSPYEDSISGCRRVLLYSVKCYLSDGSFTVVSDTNNVIAIKKGALNVEKCEICIQYHPNILYEHYIVTLSYRPYCNVQIDSIPAGINHIRVNLPTLNYYSLSYKPYQDYKVRILSRNRILMEGEVLKTYPKHPRKISFRKELRMQLKHLGLE